MTIDHSLHRLLLGSFATRRTLWGTAFDAASFVRGATRRAPRDLSSLPRGDALLEYFRRIYLAARPGWEQGTVNAIGITSSIAGEGRTTIATGVATAMAADLDRPVVLVEMHMAHAGMHQLLGVERLPGLAEYLRHECSLSEAVRQISDRLFVLPAGDGATEAPRLIHQLVRADLRSRLGGNNVILVFDLPPIHSTSYGVLASTMAEALIFVVHAGRTSSEQVRESLARLEEQAVRSVVLNAFQPQIPEWLRGVVHERI
jgi:Mrp family chromosome partitioning ATPase